MARNAVDGGIEEALATGKQHFQFPRDRWAGIKRNVVGVISGAAIIILIWWALAILIGEFRGVAFPTPPDVFSRFADALGGADLQGSSIYDQTLASLMRWGMGYVLAVGIGLSIGCLLGMYRNLHELSIVSIYILQLVPGLAWIPIALLLFGLGEVSTIFMIFMAALPPIIISTASGIRSAPPVYEKVAGMAETDFSTKFWQVLLPASAISVINGLRNGLANSWRVLIAAEMVVGVALGLGYTIIQSRYDLDYRAAFVSIIVICIIGILVEKGFFQFFEERIRDRLGLDRGEG